MLTVLARLTFWKKTKNKKSYFRGSVALHALEHSRTDQINATLAKSDQSITGFISQQNTRLHSLIQ
jgi:DICT domain-containing protein